MKFKHQISLYAAGAGATTLIASLLSVRDQLIAVGPWVLDTMLAASASALLYGGFRVFVAGRQHWLTMRSQVLEVRTQEQRYLHEGQRNELELLDMRANIHLKLGRIYADPNGNYPVLLPGTFVGPAEMVGNILALPSGQIKGTRQSALAQQAQSLADEQGRALPTNVLYQDIRHLVPHGHVLVGVGYEGVETKPQAVGACVWIVGLSGTGKTSTTVLRVEERKQDGHRFVGVDPHWFKDDSLTNAIGAYEGDFLMPMAKTPEETLDVLNAFLAEFQARKTGQRAKPWQKVTLLVDEVGSLMDKATAGTQAEREIIDLLPSIARICGQEARNFLMGGIFISQQATGLAWLRKVALMIIVHQLLQESEKKIATNSDTQAMEEMKYWPIGRTYVFGVGFQEGPRTVQQPYFKPEVESTEDTDEMVALPSMPHLWVVPDERNTDEMAEVDDQVAKGVQAYQDGARTIDEFQAAMGLQTQHQARGLLARVKQAIREGA